MLELSLQLKVGHGGTSQGLSYTLEYSVTRQKITEKKYIIIIIIHEKH